MADRFEYDAFLCHSPADTAVAQEVAERLGADELRVWFAEWEIAPGEDR